MLCICDFCPSLGFSVDPLAFKYQHCLASCSWKTGFLEMAHLFSVLVIIQSRFTTENGKPKYAAPLPRSQLQPDDRINIYLFLEKIVKCYNQ